MNLAQVFLSGRDRFPDAVAVHHATHPLTYDQAHRDVERIAAHLVHLGIRPGQIVATDIQRPVGHWMVLVALLRVGAVSVSLTDRFSAETAALPEISTVISGPDEDRIYPAGVRRIHVGQDWLREDPPPGQPLPSAAEAAASLGRICFTSGTAGAPKAIALDAGRLGARLSGTARRTRINTRSVLWCGLGPDTAYGFTAAIATWLEGGAVVFSRGGTGASQYFADRHVNLVVASPAALTTLLRDTSPEAPPPMARTVIVAGGRLSVALRDALLNRICTEVLVAYGSSETGGITLGEAGGLDRHPGHVGTVFPDVEARIIGENGEDLPAGSAGLLRVRTPSSVNAYLNAPRETAGHFVDGWFQSGDVAMLAEDRTLTMLGRPADVLNLGGVKISAEEIDTVAREHKAIEDACAILLSEGEVGQELAIVIVGLAPSGADLAAHIRAKLPSTPRFCLVGAASLPRSSMGKVNRRTLAAEVAAALADPASEGAARYARLPGMF
jgi:long-chain acyl-CoA synthetase